MNNFVCSEVGAISVKYKPSRNGGIVFLKQSRVFVNEELGPEVLEADMLAWKCLPAHCSGSRGVSAV